MTQPEMSIDGGVTLSDVERRIEAQEKRIGALYIERERSRDPQYSAANSLIQILAELQHIRGALTTLNEGAALFGGAAASRSSVQLEQGAKEVRLVVKLYESSPLGTLGDEAVAEFGRLFRMIEQRQLTGWAESVAALERDGTR